MEPDNSNKKRQITRSIVVYLGGSWVVIEAFSFIVGKYQLPASSIDFLMILIFFGLPIAIIHAYNYNEWNKNSIILSAAITVVACGTLVYQYQHEEWLRPSRLSVVNSSNVESESLRSIAVMPIRNLSGNADQEYITAGIQEALITELGHIGSLRVLSRQSTNTVSKSDKTLPQIGEQLGVDGLIEASVLLSDETLRLQVRLVSLLGEEKSIWTQTFDRNLGDILTLYGEMAEAITRKIHLKINDYEQSLLQRDKQVDPEAYKAYLKGQYQWEKLNGKAFDSAMYYFNKAVELDPEFSGGYIGQVLVWGGRLQFGLVSNREALPEIERSRDVAMMLDNSSYILHHTLAVMYTWGQWEWEKAKKEFELAISINPNAALTRAYYAHYLQYVNKPAESAEQMDLALTLDPFNPAIHTLHAMNLNMMHKFDNAKQVLNKILKENPNFYMAYTTLRTVNHNLKLYDRAFEAWKTSYKNDSILLQTLVNTYENIGYQKALEEVARELIKRSEKQYVSSWQIATLLTRAGKGEEAVGWLEKAYEEHDSNMPYLSADPIFDYIRDDPKFQELMKKMDLKQYRN